MNKKLVKLFIVEDDEMFGRMILKTLEKHDHYDISLFKSGNDFLNHLSENPDIVSLDYNLPDSNGLELLRKTKNFNDETAVIVLSAQESAEVVVEAYKTGASNYIIKNDRALVELEQSILNISKSIQLKNEIDSIKEQLIDRGKYNRIIGESPAILKVLRLVEKVEKSNILVLITGESGTGKELVAKAIHYNSPRKRKPFVAVNMAAIPEDLIESELFGHEKGAFTGAVSKRIGKFEEADGGTIFLDEIGEMDINLQTKLLRVLQENKINRVGSNKQISLDLRVIAATNRNLSEQVKDGKFREDLYYRLQGFLIHMPPLRERGNDIVILAKFFLKDFIEKNNMSGKTFSHDAMERIIKHSWPGNIRELKSLVERAALISDHDQIQEMDLVFSQEV